MAMTTPPFEDRTHDPLQIAVPSPTAPWFPEVNEFALTWNAYERVGSLDAVHAIASAVDGAMDRGAIDEVSVDDLRTTLFFYQRASHHTDSVPRHHRVAAILEALSQKTGGVVPGPGDELP